MRFFFFFNHFRKGTNASYFTPSFHIIIAVFSYMYLTHKLFPSANRNLVYMAEMIFLFLFFFFSSEKEFEFQGDSDID